MSGVIVVDGVALPERLVAEEAQNHPAATPDEARMAAAHALAIKALLLDRAHQLGLTPQAEQDEDGREETPEEALVRAVLDLEIEVERPGEAECQRVYDSAPCSSRKTGKCTCGKPAKPAAAVRPINWER